MKRYIKMISFILLAFLVITCKDDKKRNETMTEGTTTLLVDETLTPIVEDQVEIFESRYTAKIKLESKSEAEVILALAKDSSRVAILARTLNAAEAKVFERKKVIPRVTPFAKDAIALIANKNNNDTVIALQEVIEFMHGKNQSKFKGLVFDNLNSSTARYISELAGIKTLPADGVFSFKTNNEVIQYVAKNDGMIGVVGINYIFDPVPSMQQYIDKINVLSVKGNNGNQYFSPTQNNIAEGKYPLARDLYVVNCQGYVGLGMGFSTFVAGETGQRIILKSGLVPQKVPSRKIRIRNQINNDKK
jgi:phosphate transport system substrate-binding protein